MDRRWLVVDCETTGFGKRDRIVEIAAVEVDVDTGDVVDEFDTLVNPERDVGPTNVHGITASMVEAAPTFAEIAAALARRMHGSTLVAHNLSFDSRMLSQEFGRIDTTFVAGSGYCTLRATSEKLGVACRRHEIAATEQHQALADARATAVLLTRVYEAEEADGSDQGLAPCHIGYIDGSGTPRTQRRTGMGMVSNEMVRTVSKAHYPYSDEAMLAYLDMLDWVLDDHVITADERRELTELAQDLGVSPAQARLAHQRYFDAVVAAALRDHVVTPDEHELMQLIAVALELPEVPIPDITELPSVSGIDVGARVCFTGTAVVDGRHFERDDLEHLATRAGLQPVGSVTKKGCDLLVAADASSLSGKAKKARQYQIPIMEVSDFLDCIN
ncbi:exonuclease domain-containing protein [Candidatus Poriferisodalis sp.]|uniref:exonuclease domain-containing protein n=1 Tax=Candidatus Poriferisodalis sp. TaxID=3101277 RepID=UPI003D0F3576